MPTLVIDPAGDNIVVACREAGLAAPRLVGGVDYAGAGNERSFVRAELRNVPISFIRVVPSVARQIRDKFAKRAQVPCAGDVFLNADPTEIVVCSGEYTDRMMTAGPHRMPDLLLHEVDNGDTQAFEEFTSQIFLSNATSPLDGTKKQATPTFATASAGGVGSEILMDTTTIPTCGTFPNPGVTCATAIGPAERIWLLDGAIVDGYITGSPRVDFLSNGGTGDHWALQDCFCKIFIVRGGVDVATWVTGFSNGNGGFAGGTITMSAPPVIFPALTGDQIRVELYGRAARHGGYNTSDYQTVFFGGSTFGGAQTGVLFLGGDASLLWPP